MDFDGNEMAHTQKIQRALPTSSGVTLSLKRIKYFISSKQSNTQLEKIDHMWAYLVYLLQMCCK